MTAGKQEGAARTRRRGDALEQAIFDATLRIANEQGYAAVTFASVAAAAHTSRSVIYRKWGTPFELLHAAVIDSIRRDNATGQLSAKTYANGSLRADLLELMGDFASRADMNATNLLVQALHAELAQDSSEIVAFARANEESNLLIINRILDAAHARGECPRTAAQVPRSVRLLPFELIRYQAVFLRNAIAPKQLAAMVDDILIPLMG
jgi:AcrR family transcriptional regulator